MAGLGFTAAENFSPQYETPVEEDPAPTHTTVTHEYDYDDLKTKNHSIEWFFYLGCFLFYINPISTQHSHIGSISLPTQLEQKSFWSRLGHLLNSSQGPSNCGNVQFVLQVASSL